MIKSIGVLGGGSFGTALANLLAKKGFEVHLWVHNPRLAETMAKTGKNSSYLPELCLSPNLHPTSDIRQAVVGQKVLLEVVPSHLVREVMELAGPHIEEDVVLISATKGMERESFQLMDEVLLEFYPHPERLCFLSGPSFALEVAREQPTGVVVASRDSSTAELAQKWLSTSYFRVYTTRDVKGLLTGGAVKNVVALATGISDGLKLGLNSRAALITRGLAEMVRLGKKLGAEPLTLSGLAGMGDLVLTCTGELSRNRRVGIKLGEGDSLEKILGEMNMVAEGVKTTEAVWKLSRELKVEMPIVDQVYQILYRGKSPALAVEELMTRPLKAEIF